MKKCYCLFFLFVFVSCSVINNETVFDHVVAHYKDNREKQEAARYLQKHAKYHYGVGRHLNNQNAALKLREGIKNDSVYRVLLDSLGYHYVEGIPIMDDDSLTESFLLENIDLAFEVWKNPWNKNLSFGDFCRYILPYRNGDEELHEWRRYLRDKYAPSILDSVADPTSVRAVALYLISQFRNEIAYGPSMGPFTRGLLTADGMEKIHWMDCRGCAHYVTLAMRACGVPCAMITTYWRFTEVPHTTVFFPAVGNNLKAFRLTIGDDICDMSAPKDSMASWCTWMTSYDVNDELLDLINDYEKSKCECQTLKNFALPITRQDVTPEFSTTYSELVLPVPDSLWNKKHLFLCRFHNWRWYPIRLGHVKKDSVLFSNVTIRQWYRLGYADADSIRTFGNTFTLVGDSGKTKKNVSGIIRPYDNSGDSVIYKIAFGCKADESRLVRPITVYYWDTQNRWFPIKQNAILWGFNEERQEYRIFDESLRGEFKPVFHLFQKSLPKWTVFTNDELPRPLGYIYTEKETGEGCLMQF